MQPDYEADNLQAFLLKEYGAPRLDDQFSADLIGRLRAAAAPTRTRRSALALCLGAAAVAALLLAVIWISNRAAPGTNQMSGDADSDLASHRPNPPVVTPGASARGESVALKPGPAVRREDTEELSLILLSWPEVLKNEVPSATVIVVAATLGYAPATGRGNPSDRFIFWMVTRVIKGKLTEKVFSTRAFGKVFRTRVPSNFTPMVIGTETIVMFFADRHAAEVMHVPIKYEPQTKALVPKDRVATAGLGVLKKKRSAAELDADWRALRGGAATAFPALGRLVASPDNAVAFLGKQLQKTRPVDTRAKPVDSKRVKRLIGDLDHDQFRAREQATKELGALGHLAGPALRKALAGKPSPEAEARMLPLLARVNANPSPEMIQQKRAVQVLEFIGNPEARRLLKKLAAGPPTWLTQEAKAAAARLAKRATVAP